MKSNSKFILILFCSLICMNIVKAQAIRDVSFEVEGEQIYIYYTLTSSQNDEFEITTS